MTAEPRRPGETGDKSENSSSRRWPLALALVRSSSRFADPTKAKEECERPMRCGVRGDRLLVGDVGVAVVGKAAIVAERVEGRFLEELGSLTASGTGSWRTNVAPELFDTNEFDRGAPLDDFELNDKKDLLVASLVLSLSFVAERSRDNVVELPSTSETSMTLIDLLIGFSPSFSTSATCAAKLTVLLRRFARPSLVGPC
eukprot:TRINITY_DN5077_c0_g1_i5.p3 TRINITY_DN5077_c0_g1~~TRINITY_DN5077_c0_g1_i5.p3  ORF type:complete len:200 (-),score=31.05 TRINITY_DN5077_c0_g1_i5:205-804(-)